jgi:hypothetical protein
MGLSFKEIAAVIPVHKGTLSGWCADLVLTPDQLKRLSEKRPALATQSRIGAARRMQARRERALTRSNAHEEARCMLHDPRWVAGVIAYWCEGSKSGELRFANSDPALVRVFRDWSVNYLGVTFDRFTLALHLHNGQDEAERKQFWSLALAVPLSQFRKTYIKPEGTGHRKNLLYAGTASLRVSKSGELLQRVLGWIDALSPSPV